MTSNATDGRGCSLQLPSDFAHKSGAFVFTSNYDRQAVINVDGADQQLTLTKSNDSERPSAGTRSTYWYAGPDGLGVRVDFVVTGVCPRGNESCGVTYYDAVLSVKRGKQSKTVAAKAVCGT